MLSTCHAFVKGLTLHAVYVWVVLHTFTTTQVAITYWKKYIR